MTTLFRVFFGTFLCILAVWMYGGWAILGAILLILAAIHYRG